MRRISKREIGFRFDLQGVVRVRIHRLEGGHAVTKLNGIECRLDVLRSERRDLGNVTGVLAHVDSLPPRLGDGWLPRGKGSPKADLGDFFSQCSGGRPVCLRSQGLDHPPCRYEAFARLHPVGSLVEAEVIQTFNRKVRLRFDGGIVCTMANGDYVHRWPRGARIDRDRIDWPRRIEVIVRRIDVRRQYLDVSTHGYPKDDKYCDAAAGYRSGYDAQRGIFRRLPWEKDSQP